MATHEITKHFSNKGSRNEVRLRVVKTFSNEEPGTRGNASKYIYYVEILSDGNRIYLQRPANLHNGFDFLVCVENTNYAEPGQRRRNYPKHTDIGEDLKQNPHARASGTTINETVQAIGYCIYSCQSLCYN